MVVGLFGNESPDSNRFILVTPKSENDVRLQVTLGNQNPTGLPVGAVRKSNGIGVDKDMAKEIRSTVGNITTETIQRVYGLDKPLEQIKEAVSVMIPARVYRRFFLEVAVKDVGGIVEEALEQYFDRKGA